MTKELEEQIEDLKKQIDDLKEKADRAKFDSSPETDSTQGENRKGWGLVGDLGVNKELEMSLYDPKVVRNWRDVIESQVMSALREYREDHDYAVSIASARIISIARKDSLINSQAHILY